MNPISIPAAPPGVPAPTVPPSPGSARNTPLTGLTADEVRERRTRGLGNTVDLTTSRSYTHIVMGNVFTFLNVSLYAIGVVLIALGLPKDALLSSGFAIVNALLGIVQESVAKRRLDRIALLARMPATVIRDGVEQSAQPGDLVVGDLVVLRPGDQALLDGEIVGATSIAMDESLLTGESDAIAKAAGDPVYAGSFALSGMARYVTTATSSQSMTSGIVNSARAFRISLTPLQRNIHAIVRLLLGISSLLLAVLIVSSFVWDVALKQTALAAAVVLGIVPSGLFVMLTVTYTMAAVRLAGRNALIQQMNAVESLSNVDMFCLDKTGTLTSNRLRVEHVEPIGGMDACALRSLLGTMSRSVETPNATDKAIAEACAGTSVTVRDAVPFASARKWSAVATDEGPHQGVIALGAPEMLGRHLAVPAPEVPDTWLAAGLRILLVAHSARPAGLHDEAGAPVLPADLAPVGWVTLADELRDNTQETLDAFRKAGITLKIISGDNPQTVAALARQAGFADDLGLVSGVDLETMDEAGFEQAARQATVFGRISPAQKAQLVEALQRQGHYVAMTGDGVNDVMSLKRANLAIAMQSGSQATRAAADIVLLNDSFQALPEAFLEGQRVRRGLEGVLELFLTRVFVVLAALVMCAIARLGFPFLPGNISLLTMLTVGFPTFGLALWAHAATPSRSLIRSVVEFVVPAVATMSIAAFAVYVVLYLAHDFSLSDVRQGAGNDLITTPTVARDALTYVLILGGLVLVPFACPPTPWWAVIERLSGDWRPTLLAAAMVPLFVVIVALEPSRSFFGVRVLTFGQYLVLAGVVLGWAFVLRAVYRYRLFPRFFGLAQEVGVRA